jgi:hypothetical protein
LPKLGWLMLIRWFLRVGATIASGVPLSEAGVQQPDVTLRGE